MPPVRNHDVRRYFVACAAAASLILGIVVVITGAVVLASLVLPKTYQAIHVDRAERPAGHRGHRPDHVQRQLATLQTLIASPRRPGRAPRPASRRGPLDLAGKIDARSTPTPTSSTSRATRRNPSRGGAIANEVSRTFLASAPVWSAADRACARAPPDRGGPAGRPRRRRSPGGRAAQRISQLSVNEGSAGADLQLASEPRAPIGQLPPAAAQRDPGPRRVAVPRRPRGARPRPLSPRIGDPRELGRRSNSGYWPASPYVRGLRRRRAAVMSGVEAEAYETVRAGWSWWPGTPRATPAPGHRRRCTARARPPPCGGWATPWPGPATRR